MLLDIAEVAHRSGLASSALRFYERRGLITSGSATVCAAPTSRRCSTGSR